MTSTRKCGACGASPREDGGDYCSFCGAELPQIPAVILSVDAERHRQLKFDAVQKEIETRRKDALQRGGEPGSNDATDERPLTRADRVEATLIGLLTLATLGGLFFLFGPKLGTDAEGKNLANRLMAAIAGSLPLLSVLIIATPPLILWMLSASGERTRRRLEGRGGRFAGTSMVALRLVERVTEGSAKDPFHSIIVELPDGQRSTYRIDRNRIGDDAAGDFGVGYVKGRRLVRFHRVGLR